MTPLETNLAAALRANSALRVQAERPIAEYIEPCATGAALINDLIRLFDGIRPEPARAGADQENSVPDALATAPPVGGELGAHDVTGVTAEREHQSAEQRDW